MTPVTLVITDSKLNQRKTTIVENNIRFEYNVIRLMCQKVCEKLLIVIFFISLASELTRVKAFRLFFTIPEGVPSINYKFKVNVYSILQIVACSKEVIKTLD